MKQIQITEHFHAFGPEFEELKPGTLCTTVPAPEGQENLKGVWVMGKTEPVRLVRGEYIEVEDPEN